MKKESKKTDDGVNNLKSCKINQKMNKKGLLNWEELRIGIN